MERLQKSNNLLKLRELTEKLVPFSDIAKPCDECHVNIDMEKGGGYLKRIYSCMDHAIPGCSIALGVMKKGTVMGYHTHPEAEFCIVLEGELKITIKGEEIILKKADCHKVDPMVPHKVEWLEDSRLICVTIPESESFPNARTKCKQ